MPRGQSIAVRGIRGATTVEKDSPADILDATRRLLALMIRRNDLSREDISGAVFTTTTDLKSASPAEAARQLGWLDIPLLSAHEMDVPNPLRKCIGVLIHCNTDKPSNEINHVYLNQAKTLALQSSELSDEELNELNVWLEQHLHEHPNSDDNL